MKKFLLVASMMLLYTSVFAQINWGIKGGLNLSDITNYKNSDFKPSIYAGIFIEKRISGFITIQPELIYSRQGTFFKNGDTKIWDRLNYINLPVVAKMNLGRGISLDIGPQFGFLAGSSVKFKQDGKTFSYSGGQDRKFDISAAMGLSCNISETINISARYNLGLTKLIDYRKKAPKNSVIQIGMGLRL